MLRAEHFRYQKQQVKSQETGKSHIQNIKECWCEWILLRKGVLRIQRGKLEPDIQGLSGLTALVKMP